VPAGCECGEQAACDGKGQCKNEGGAFSRLEMPKLMSETTVSSLTTPFSADEGSLGCPAGENAPQGLYGPVEAHLARLVIVEEAKTWIGTPFHLNSATKGMGVDCGRLPHAVLRKLGYPIPDLPIKHWSGQFMLNKAAYAEPYLRIVQSAMHEVTEPAMGDLAVFHSGNCIAHAGIVVTWPEIIHARGIGTHPCVERTRADRWPLRGHTVRFFSVLELACA
jgi:hypothetical protein